ncbi:MAG: Sec-independent protein translocase protein TatB [Thermodesulfobacteriota bacterium]
MFGIGFTELLLVLVVALLVLGPDKLPEVARTVAKAYNELRRTGLDLKRTIKDVDISGIVREGVEGVGVNDKAEAGGGSKDTVTDSASTEGAGKASEKAT